MPLKLSDKVNFGLGGARDREKAKNLEEKKNKGRRTNSNNTATAQSKTQTNPSGVDEALLDNEYDTNNNTRSNANTTNNKSTASGQHQQDSTSASSTQKHLQITQRHIEPSDANMFANRQMMEEEENEKQEVNKEKTPLEQVVAMNRLELAADQDSDDEHEERTRDVDVQQAVEPKNEDCRSKEEENTIDLKLVVRGKCQGQPRGHGHVAPTDNSRSPLPLSDVRPYSTTRKKIVASETESNIDVLNDILQLDAVKQFMKDRHDAGKFVITSVSTSTHFCINTTHPLPETDAVAKVIQERDEALAALSAEQENSLKISRSKGGLTAANNTLRAEVATLQKQLEEKEKNQTSPNVGAVRLKKAAVAYEEEKTKLSEYMEKAIKLLGTFDHEGNFTSSKDIRAVLGNSRPNFNEADFNNDEKAYLRNRCKFFCDKFFPNPPTLKAPLSLNESRLLTPESILVLNLLKEVELLKPDKLFSIVGYKEQPGSGANAKAWNLRVETANDQLKKKYDPARVDAISPGMGKLTSFISSLLDNRRKNPQDTQRITVEQIQHTIQSSGNLASMYPSSRSSILRACAYLNLRYTLPTSIVYLTDWVKNARRRMAVELRKYAAKDASYYSRLVFSDECKIYEYHRFLPEIQEVGKRLKVNLGPSKSRGLMIWACIHPDMGIVCYEIYKDESLDSERYIRTLREKYLNIAMAYFKKYGHKLILVEDGAPCHMATKTHNFFLANKKWLQGLVWIDKEAEEFIMKKIKELEKKKKENEDKKQKKKERAEEKKKKKVEVAQRKAAAAEKKSGKRRSRDETEDDDDDEQQQQQQQEEEEEHYDDANDVPLVNEDDADAGTSTSASDESSKYTTTYQAMGWVPHSPDLNPIELLWRYMKEKMRKDYGPHCSLDHRYAQITALFKHPDTIAYAKKLCRYFPYAMEMVATGRIESSKHLLFDGQNIYSLDGEKRKLVSELQEKYEKGGYVHDSILKRFVEKDLEAEARAVENSQV